MERYVVMSYRDSANVEEIGRRKTSAEAEQLKADYIKEHPATLDDEVQWFEFSAPLKAS
ncbi:hypothetical protein [Rhizobium sp. P007]|uniref:hypothetical protein n=1 Tax=Rhizobium sp. P007 TaxID=285908 RepID=UPI00163CC568|nr:hypothetical protein [Rhizobium sp. P007]CAD7041177.1 hypothetical protein RP007_00717 [Rhizobium sp. P007]